MITKSLFHDYKVSFSSVIKSPFHQLDRFGISSQVSLCIRVSYRFSEFLIVSVTGFELECNMECFVSEIDRCLTLQFRQLILNTQSDNSIKSSILYLSFLLRRPCSPITRHHTSQFIYIIVTTYPYHSCEFIHCNHPTCMHSLF